MRVIIGAGLSGLVAGLTYRKHGIKDFVILEASGGPGGLCSSKVIDGWVFDRTGHFLHCHDRRVIELIRTCTPLRKIKRDAKVLWRGSAVPYPFQENLFYVPSPVRVDMVYEAARAHFQSNDIQVRTFQDWIIKSVGIRIAEDFLIPYVRKSYAVEPSQLTPEQGGSYIPSPDLKKIISGAVKKGNSLSGYNAEFYYPCQGGIGEVASALAYSLRDHILFRMEVVYIDFRARRIYCRDGTVFDYDGPLVSTIPLPRLIQISSLPNNLKIRAQCSLKATKVLCVNVAIIGSLTTPVHWYYVTDPNIPFYRIGSLSNVSPSTVPEGCSSLWAEVALCPDFVVTPSVVKSLTRQVVDSIQQMGLLAPKSRIAFVDSDLIPCAYVLYTKGRSEFLSEIRPVLDNLNVVCLGRYGRWVYDSMEGAIKDGLSIEDILG
ncbi:MAG: NAD(P)-binding protein [Synergistales bacterium]|nr:NAD(P)-binding protein [Synergistales bacterium]